LKHTACGSDFPELQARWRAAIGLPVAGMSWVCLGRVTGLPGRARGWLAPVVAWLRIKL